MYAVNLTDCLSKKRKNYGTIYNGIFNLSVKRVRLLINVLIGLNEFERRNFYVYRIIYCECHHVRLFDVCACEAGEILIK